mgnify:CR=1 FL=1
MVNNQSVTNKMSEISAYVRQEDLFLGELTVREHLEFRARMMNMSEKERQPRIERSTKIYIIPITIGKN